MSLSENTCELKAYKVAIVHPWLPQYRIAFFDYLVQACAARNISVDIYYGETPPEWRARGDSGSTAVATKLKTKFLKVGSRSLIYRSAGRVYQSGPYDLVVFEQAIRNLETYLLLLARWRLRKVAFWGHGRTYTISKSRFEERFKRWLTHKGCWFFAYTEGGARAMEEYGFQSERVTVVENSIDTVSFRRDLAKAHVDESAKSESHHTALYIGGLDSAKRIEFLLNASKAVANLNPKFRLVLCGDGELRPLVEKFCHDNAWASYEGPLFGVEKARAFVKSCLLLIPGRVGLVAVDSLVSGVPIVTTDNDLHAPEFEYLTPGRTCFVSQDSTDSYAATILDLLRDKLAVAQASRSCVHDSHHFSAESMAARFASGIAAALS